jgi:hypothetical protein
MKNLPTGISAFQEIRSRNVVYVDKTQLIYNIISKEKYYFLSRPRRFGKSLTVSTIAEIYAGNKELFRGLWIEDHWDWSKVHPVIHLSFNGLNYRDLGLTKVLATEMTKTAEKHDIILQSKDAPSMFRELIETLSQKKGKVVILIDEYDKPLTDFLEKERLPQALENRDILRNFYGMIKALDDSIEFFFMTGVSKFSHVNLFSQLNNLTDISMSSRYATLTGYTQEEFENYFSEWITSLVASNPGQTREGLLAAIKTWYNGYTFDAKHFVYNPYSILLFLADGSFNAYWFKTGTPLFLINLLKEKQFFILNDLRAHISVFDSFDLENIEPMALMFQTGYLTIKSVDWETRIFVLDYPNREVSEAMQNQLIGALLNRYPSQAAIPVHDVRTAFLQNDTERAMEVIQSLFADVPYDLFRGKPEGFYHALVHLLFRYLGLFIDSEVHTSGGRMDAVVQTPTHVYILEFKINTGADEAFRQIVEKGYADRYHITGKPIIGMGISFDTANRKVGEWKTERL